MKRIIDGKRYDTETAESVAGWSNGCGYEDFDYLEETLYRTRNGNWFLYGIGGARSTYRRACGSRSWCASSAILAMTPEAAYDWLERCEFVDQIEKFFPDRIAEA